MPRMLVVVGIVLLGSVPARADWYSTPSVWAGPSSYGKPVTSLRNAVGYAGTDGSLGARAGLTLDVTGDSNAFSGPFFGVETQVDWDVGAGWHFGPRLATSVHHKDMVVAMAGLRLRNDSVSFGIDGAYSSGIEDFVETPQFVGFTRRRAGTVTFGMGLEGKPGKWATLVEGIALSAMVLYFANVHDD